jgi:hypothetical protein
MVELQRMMISGMADLQLQDPNLLCAPVKHIIRGNRRLAVREVAKEAGISTGSCHTILTEDLGMHRASAKSVPRLLTYDQRLFWRHVLQHHFNSTIIIPQFTFNAVSSEFNWLRTGPM